MNRSLTGVALIIGVLAIECGLAAWRDWPVPEGRGDLFTLSLDGGWSESPRRIGQAVAAYRADRGVEEGIDLGGGVKITVFYFEFDRLEAASMMQLTRHEPEICNVAAGFEFLGRSAPRKLVLHPDKELVFDVTSFARGVEPDAHVFKLIWLEGSGSADLSHGYRRSERLAAALSRKAGGARVLQAGVSGAKDEQESWDIFRREVLEKLVWNHTPL